MKELFYSTILILSGIGYSQDTITLQMCIDGSKRNINLYSSENRVVNQADLNLKYNKWSLLPSVTGSSSFNTSFGRRVDPFTNTFATNTVNSQSFGLNTIVPVFNGLNYFYSKNKLEIEKEKSEVNLLQKQNENSIKVIELYVELCKLQFQKELGQVRIEKYQQLQSIQKTLLKGGKINSVDTLKSYNSLLVEESILINLNNQLSSKTVDLNYLIGMTLTTLHSYSVESINNITEEIDFSEKYDEKILELELFALKEQLGIDRARILPSFSISGSMGTGYSTNNKDYTTPGNLTFPYNEQLNKNLYEGIGVNLSIPIFNKGTYLKAKQISELSQSELEQRKQLKSIQKEKRKVQNEQQIFYMTAELDLFKKVTLNLKVIYDKTLLMYQEGKITYKEVDTAFLEWQDKVLEIKKAELDLMLKKLLL